MGHHRHARNLNAGLGALIPVHSAASVNVRNGINLPVDIASQASQDQIKLPVNRGGSALHFKKVSSSF